MADDCETVDIWYSLKNGMIGRSPVDGWHFYYDETNNFRKLKFDPNKPTGYNIDRALRYDFILGGIAFDPRNVPDTELLMERIGIQKKNELKARSILKNRDFLEDIGLERTQIFLEWILDSGAIIHYSALNNLYWAVIDLVDEAIETEAGEITLPFHRMMKEQVFFFLMNHLDDMTSILSRYGFPNLEKDTISPFARAASDFILENNIDDTPELFYLELARQIIKNLRNKEETEFLSGREPGVLIDSYECEYIGAMMDKPNAIHHFDHESLIERSLKKYVLQDGKKTYDGYEFIDSKDNRFVQTSDVLVGLLSDYFHFTDTMVMERSGSMPHLSEEQKNGIGMLRDVMATSDRISPYLQKHICPQSFADYRYKFLEISDHQIID